MGSLFPAGFAHALEASASKVVAEPVMLRSRQPGRGGRAADGRTQEVRALEAGHHHALGVQAVRARFKIQRLLALRGAGGINLPHAAFRVDVAPAAADRESGRDMVEFGFAPNPGEPMRPLRSIASSAR